MTWLNIFWFWLGLVCFRFCLWRERRCVFSFTHTHTHTHRFFSSFFYLLIPVVQKASLRFENELSFSFGKLKTYISLRRVRHESYYSKNPPKQTPLCRYHYSLASVSSQETPLVINPQGTPFWERSSNPPCLGRFSLQCHAFRSFAAFTSEVRILHTSAADPSWW